MALWQIILAGIAALVALAILIEMYLKRNRPRPPLAVQFLGEDDRSRPEREDDAPGSETLDLAVLREAEMANRHAAGLGARDMQFWSGLLGKTGPGRHKATQAPARRDQESKR